ncbi:hypothetical protein BXY85_1840 [Roseivirga pacifica]|uniref:Uncharacterized protein n=1 Tax=Roseivirga pacifica TaxID=1267423 RepID=A0A1I0N073_9BACT|nr:hypothetical protein [Roseivirga pacifica]MCO6359352.1 hypothetical protein [Roseivirga pacifica]MCO6366722.1 hypothetical protein [Roseivirga pacifica]MCO6370746.1 hypothetical protein [Roseivirga pacifica]MCO6374378.1 hypothetical protein [Roseivirga pacifica]MCO6379637.1 hypothetical protein [Roseivirga pacifica]
MKTVQEIEERIEQLRWKSLPPFKRITGNKEEVFKDKFGTKERKRELKWHLLSSNILLAILAAGMLTSILFVEVNDEILLFLLLSMALVFAQRIEMSQRLNNLNEAKFLKKLLKQLK